MPTSQKIVWAGLAVTVVAILVLGYFLFLAPEKKEPLPVIPETSSLAGTRAEAAGAGEESDPAIVPLDLPLDESDAPVRAMVAAAEIPAAMKDWLRQKEIVRTVVAVVDNIAQGQSPAALLPFLAPPGKFTASEKDGVILLDPASFRRYDLLVSTITAVADKT